MTSKIVYEIVVSDFGRRSAISYLAQVERLERLCISAALRGSSRPFMDEHRLIMFCALGEVSTWRSHRILDGRSDGASPALLDNDDAPAFSRTVNAIATACYRAAANARLAEFETIRIAVPCNTLSAISPFVMRHWQGSEAGEASPIEETSETRIARLRLSELGGAIAEVITPPDAVFRCQSSSANGSTRYLLLSTRLAREAYQAALKRSGLPGRLLPATDEDQASVDRAIIHSIADNQGAAREMVERLVSRYATRHGDDLVVIQGCTDFDLPVGVNSLAEMAATAVCSVYPAGESIIRSAIGRSLSEIGATTEDSESGTR